MRNRLTLIGAVLVMSIAVACSSDEPVEQPLPLDPALTTIVSTSSTQLPFQVSGQLDPALTTIVSTSSTQQPVQVGGQAVSGVGPGLSVADAIASTLEGPLLVNGFIFTDAGDVWLCSSLLHGDPTPADLLPSVGVEEGYAMCSEPIIEVSGLDPATVEGLEFHGGAGWTNEPTQVLGLKIDGVLTVSGTMLPR